MKPINQTRKKILNLVVEIYRYEAIEEFLYMIPEHDLDRLYEGMIEINKQKEREQKEFQKTWGY